MAAIEYRDTPPYTYGQCGICGQGELVAVKIVTSGAVALMCDDYESAWSSPDRMTLIDLAPIGLVEASLADILAARWQLPEYLDYE